MKAAWISKIMNDGLIHEKAEKIAAEGDAKRADEKISE